MKKTFTLKIFFLSCLVVLIGVGAFAQTFTIGSSIKPTSCPSDATGSISVTVEGGTPPYTYQWQSSFQNSATATGLGQGDHLLTIADSLGKDTTVTFTVGADDNCEISPEPFFSPNGDGINDTWEIANAQYFDNIHLIVFDRWGTKVHEQKGKYEAWDGKSYLHIPVPVSVYYYFFYKHKDDKEKEAVHGSVTIMR